MAEDPGAVGDEQGKKGKGGEGRVKRRKREPRGREGGGKRRVESEMDEMAMEGTGLSRLLAGENWRWCSACLCL